MLLVHPTTSLRHQAEDQSEALNQLDELEIDGTNIGM